MMKLEGLVVGRVRNGITGEGAWWRILSFIKHLHRFIQFFVYDLSIDLGFLDGGMTKEFRDIFDADPFTKSSGGESMAGRMKCEFFIDFCTLCNDLQVFITESGCRGDRVIKDYGLGQVEISIQKREYQTILFNLNGLIFFQDFKSYIRKFNHHISVCFRHFEL